MVTCRELTELVTEYLDGAMPRWRRLSFLLHLGMCGHCREYLRQMRRTVRAIGQLPAAPVPAEVRDSLLDLFRDWRKE